MGTGRKEIIRIKYNKTAAGYDELYRDEQYEKYRRVLENAPNVLRQKVLCDIGCGTALLLEYLTAKGVLPARYVCLDLSPGMLDQAKRRMGTLRLSHLADVVEADAEYIPLRRCSCRAAVSFTVIDLVENPKRMLEECDRIASTCIVSSLKKAQREKPRIPRIGPLLAETQHDTIHIRRGNCF